MEIVFNALILYRLKSQDTVETKPDPGPGPDTQKHTDLRL